MTTIDNAPQWIIQLFQWLQKVEHNICLLCATAPNKDTMDIEIGD
jgi:hypothetical protein